LARDAERHQGRSFFVRNLVKFPTDEPLALADYEDNFGLKLSTLHP
jgi:hypothetical protein